MPLAPDLEQVLTTVGAALGVKFEVVSGGQPKKGTSEKRTGSERHDEGRAADVKMYVEEGGKKTYIPHTTTEGRQLWSQAIQFSVALGAQGVGAAEDYMGKYTAHIGYGTPAAWGAGGRAANVPTWVKSAFTAGMAGKIPATTGVSPTAFKPTPATAPVPATRTATAYAPATAPRSTAATNAIANVLASAPAGRVVNALAAGYRDELAPITVASSRMPTPQEADAAARRQVANYLAGSNVNVGALSPAEQTRLLNALPGLMSIRDQQQQLNYLKQTGAWEPLLKAVPTREANFLERNIGGVNRVPLDVETWKLPASPEQVARELQKAVRESRNPVTSSTEISRRANAPGPGVTRADYEASLIAAGMLPPTRTASLFDAPGTGGTFSDLQAFLRTGKVQPTYTVQQRTASNPEYLKYISSMRADPVGAGATFADLEAFRNGPPPEQIATERRVQTPSEDVRRLQQALALAGFSPGSIDGLMGPQTQSAVKAFQTANGLSVDGIAGPQTLGALGNALGFTQPAPQPKPQAQTGFTLLPTAGVTGSEATGGVQPGGPLSGSYSFDGSHFESGRTPGAYYDFDSNSWEIRR